MSATTGALNMRVRISFSQDGAIDPCAVSTYGETEDYTVNITAAAGLQGLNADLVSIYPNPTTDDVIIELPAIDYYVSYSIFNGQGQLIDTGNITDRSVLLTLDFHHLSSGVYNIRLYSSELKIPANLSIIKQ